MFSLFRLRGLVYTLVGTLVLTTLWVTSLAQLTARPAATDLLTEVGTQVLNPFLVSHNLGMSQAGYATLETAARAHPSQALSLTGLKVAVPGHEIVGLSYADATRVVYRHVANTYYDSGAQAAFAIPPELQTVLNTYGMFNPSNLQQLPQSVGGQSLPQVPSLPQIPSFVQPLFTVTGLTPDTFTAAGHSRLLGLLPFFWLALIIWLALTAVFDRSGNRFRALLRGAVHGTWPVVALLVGLWVLSRVYPDKFAPYMGLLGIVSRTVLLFYGGALAFCVLALVLLRVARRGQPAAARTPEMAMAGVPAMRGQAGAQMQQAMQIMQQMQGRAGMSASQMPPSAQMSQAPMGWQEPQMPRGWEQASMPPAGQTGWQQSGSQLTGQQPGWQQQEWQQAGSPNWQQAPSRQPVGQPMDQPGWEQPAATPQDAQSGQAGQSGQSGQAGQAGQMQSTPPSPPQPRLPTIPPEWDQPPAGAAGRDAGDTPPPGAGGGR